VGKSGSDAFVGWSSRTKKQNRFFTGASYFTQARAKITEESWETMNNKQETENLLARTKNLMATAQRLVEQTTELLKKREELEHQLAEELRLHPQAWGRRTSEELAA
jgi:predicted S18 family serine protease